MRLAARAMWMRSSNECMHAGTNPLLPAGRAGGLRARLAGVAGHAQRDGALADVGHAAAEDLDQLQHLHARGARLGSAGRAYALQLAICRATLAACYSMAADDADQACTQP